MSKVKYSTPEEKKEAARKRANEWYYKNKEYAREQNELWKKNNPNKMNEYNKKYASNNKDKLYKKSRTWAKENQERIKILQKEAKERNPEKYKNTIIEWNKRNSGKLRQKDAAYKAKKKAGTLASDTYKKELESIYANCPEGYEVDHIIPIIHKDICGLHVPWNLQYLPKKENRSKGNRLCLE